MAVSSDSPGVAVVLCLLRFIEYRMTILTIAEAAIFLRLSRRTMYTLKDIPRIRYAGKLVYVLEDLEAWVRSRREGGVLTDLNNVRTKQIDDDSPRSRRRRAIFVLPTESKSK